MIQDLYAKRVQLNQAIEALEAVLNEETRGKSSAMSQAFAAAEQKVNGGTRSEWKKPGDADRGDKIRSAPQRPALGECQDFWRLKAAGVKFRSSNPQLSVSQVLSRNSKTSGAPVRVGRGRWALQ